MSLNDECETLTPQQQKRVKEKTKDQIVVDKRERRYDVSDLRKDVKICLIYSIGKPKESILFIFAKNNVIQAENMFNKLAIYFKCIQFTSEMTKNEYALSKLDLFVFIIKSRLIKH
jgi:hypothetical protein